ncbi:MAG: chorismate mutase [Firmicutes bacterium]|nr:chorismate mutase [Bacillota bacterium]
MPVRAIRGATTIDENTVDEIIKETKHLLRKMVEENNIEKDDIISIIFSTTRDINATFPAVAAREMGWTDIALMCTNEMEVPGSLQMCIRVLMHINTKKTYRKIKYVYLKGAKVLRPEFAE